MPSPEPFPPLPLEAWKDTRTTLHRFSQIVGKVFWHSLDLALTRLSGKAVALGEVDSVAREAYSHEVISAGFWAGDDTFPEPAFYAYAAPEPDGLREEPLRPEGAFWQEVNGGSMAIYRYEIFRGTSDPRVALLEFLQSSYEAAARRANWPGELTL